MNPIVAAILGVVGGLVLGVVIGALIGIQYRKRIAEAKIGSAEERAKELISEGEKKAETLKKEALLSAQEDIMRRKNDMEQEIKDRRAEVSRTESRLAKKEENLDKKSEQLDKKNEQLERKMKECDDVREQIDAVLASHLSKLEEISGYTTEQAKEEMISRIESEIKHELAQRLVELEAQFAVGHIELEEGVARRKVHILEVAHVPCRYDDASAIGVVLDSFNHLFYLVDVPTLVVGP